MNLPKTKAIQIKDLMNEEEYANSHDRRGSERKYTFHKQEF